MTSWKEKALHAPGFLDSLAAMAETSETSKSSETIGEFCRYFGTLEESSRYPCLNKKMDRCYGSFKYPVNHVRPHNDLELPERGMLLLLYEKRAVDPLGFCPR